MGEKRTKKILEKLHAKVEAAEDAQQTFEALAMLDQYVNIVIQAENNNVKLD